MLTYPSADSFCSRTRLFKHHILDLHKTAEVPAVVLVQLDGYFPYFAFKIRYHDIFQRVDAAPGLFYFVGKKLSGLFGTREKHHVLKQRLRFADGGLKFGRRERESVGIYILLVLCGACDSKGNAKKKIKEGGAYLNGEKIADAGRRLTEEDLLAGRYAQLNVGKKDFRLIKFK